MPNYVTIFTFSNYKAKVNYKHLNKSSANVLNFEVVFLIFLIFQYRIPLYHWIPCSIVPSHTCEMLDAAHYS